MKAASRPCSAYVPRYFLYGEPPRQPGERFVHIELLAERCRPHDWDIEPHMHPDLHHVLLVIEGGIDIRMDENRTVQRSPCLLIVPAGVVHTMRFQPETFGYVISMADSLVNTLRSGMPGFAQLFKLARCLQMTQEDSVEHELQLSAEALLSELRSTAQPDTLLVDARTQILLAHCARVLSHREHATDPLHCAVRSEGIVEAFRKLIELHFHENWPLQRYAKELRVSVAQLRTTCIKATGQTSIKMLHERIIREAKRHLTFTGHSVARIADDLGFIDAAYFSRFFRARAGLTPTEFRNSLRSAPAGPEMYPHSGRDAIA